MIRLFRRVHSPPLWVFFHSSRHPSRVHINQIQKLFFLGQVQGVPALGGKWRTFTLDLEVGNATGHTAMTDLFSCKVSFQKHPSVYVLYTALLSADRLYEYKCKTGQCEGRSKTWEQYQTSPMKRNPKGTFVVKSKLGSLFSMFTPFSPFELYIC